MAMMQATKSLSTTPGRKKPAFSETSCAVVVAPEAMVDALPVASYDPTVIGSIYNRAYEPTDANDRGGEGHFVIAQWL